MSHDDGDKASAPVHPAGGSEAIATEETPPILGSWSRIYAAVLLVELAIITLLYLFTRFFD